MYCTHLVDSLKAMEKVVTEFFIKQKAEGKGGVPVSQEELEDKLVQEIQFVIDKDTKD